MFMVAVEATIVATAMPDIVRRLGGFSLYSWVFAGFLLTQTATAVLFGKLADLYGRRPVLVGGIVVFLIGSALCGFAHTMPALIGYRLLQGLGAGSILPVATTIVGDLYSPEERASVQGYLSSVWGISAIVGPLAGGLIVEKLSWPWVFWINLPVGLATILGLTFFLHERVEHRNHRIDFLGAALFAFGISAFLLALTGIGQPSVSYSQIGICLLAAVVSMALFFWQEKRASEPMVSMELWSHRVIASANGAALAAGMTLIGITTFLAVYVQSVMGRSATVAGLALTMMAVGWPIASALSPRFYGKFGMRKTLRLGSLLMVAGSVVFLFLTPQSSPVLAGFGSMVMGFGMGLLNISVILLVQGSVGWAQRGSATASNVFSRNLGSTLGAAVLGSVLNFSLKASGVSASGLQNVLEHAEQYRPVLNRGLHLTFLCVVALSVSTLLLSLLIPDRSLEELSGK
jgi:EmrB/QacA subfamily drug resistance transporter